MESSENPLEKQNGIKKKLIPWHYQKRYQTSQSQISFNHTLNKALYTRKIRSLLNNNRNLAKALEKSRWELSDKENIQMNNTKNMGLISLSRLRMKEVSDNLKKVTSFIDETFELLQSHIEECPPTNLYCQNVPKCNFQNKLRGASKAASIGRHNEEDELNLEDNNGTPLSMQQMTAMIQAVHNKAKSRGASKAAMTVPMDEEYAPSSNGNDSTVWSIGQAINKKAKSRAKKTVPQPNKKDKLTAKKSKKQGLRAQTIISPEKITVRISKPHVDDTPPSYLLGISSDVEGFNDSIEPSKTKTFKCSSNKKNAMSKNNREERPCPISAISNSNNQQKELDKGSTFIQSSKINLKKVNGNKAQPKNNKSPTKHNNDKTNKGSTFIHSSKIELEKVNGDKAQPKNKKSAPRKKAKVTTIQLGSEKEQNSSKDSLSSIDEKSVEKSPSLSLETNLKALTIANAKNCQMIVSNTYTPETSANVVHKDLQVINVSIKDNLRVVLQKTDFGQSDNCAAKQTISLNKNLDESNKLPQTSAPLKSGVKIDNLRVVLEKTDFGLSDNCAAKQTISLNKNFDESNKLPQTSAPLKSSVKTTSSCKKKVRFGLEEEDNEIQILGGTQPTLPLKQPLRGTVHIPLKRPLKESEENIPRKKRFQATSPLDDDMELKKKNTFVVIAEVHQPAEGYTPPKRLTIDDIHSLNMDPRVVLTDIFMSKKIILKNVNDPDESKEKEGPSTQMVQKEPTQVTSVGSSSCEYDLQANGNKENKIGDNQNSLEDRKQSRRRSKVHSYKELNVNMKMRRF